MCRLLAAAADQKHAAMMSKLLDHYEQKDQLAQQLVGITKLQVRSIASHSYDIPLQFAVASIVFVC